MGVKLRTVEKPDLPEVRSGLYFTDRTRLLRVVEVVDQSVMLEDCGRPAGLPDIVDLRFLRERVRRGEWRRVRPA